MRFAPTTAALCALLALASVPWAIDASAQPSTGQPVMRARERFKQGEQAYREGRFQEAIDLLTEAYKLDPKPVLLYNIARAYEGLGDTPHAIEHYRRYLEADPAAPDRGALEQRIATLERQQKEREELERKRAADAAAPAPAPAPPPPAEKPVAPERRASALPWIVAGVGALGVGAGAVLGVMSKSKHDDAVAEKRAIEAGDLQSQAKTFTTAANVAFIAGGVVAAGGVIWGIVDLTSSRSSTSVALGPAALSVRGRF